MPTLCIANPSAIRFPFLPLPKVSFITLVYILHINRIVPSYVRSNRYSSNRLLPDNRNKLQQVEWVFHVGTISCENSISIDLKKYRELKCIPIINVFAFYRQRITRKSLGITWKPYNINQTDLTNSYREEP